MYINNNYTKNHKLSYNTSFCNSKKATGEDSQLRKDFFMKCSLYPEDCKYITQIAREIHLPEQEEYKLNSIIGEKQLEFIIKSASRENFNPTEIIKHSQIYTKSDLEALAKKGFKLNLHIHTKHSDGRMSVKELLDKAAEYADIVNKETGNDSSLPSFIIAITDHDTLEGSKEAVNIISSNPQKYKNLGVVLGAELSSLYRDEGTLAKPFAYELVAYSINPFDKQFNDFLARTRSSRIEASKKVIQQANLKYPDMQFSYEEACRHSRNPEKGIDGFLYTLSDYFKARAKEKGKGIDTWDLCMKYLPSNQWHIPGTANNAENIFENIKNGFGFLGIAHPARIYLGDGVIQDSFINQCNANNQDAGNVIIEKFISYLKDICKDKFNAIETNYQSYDGPLKEGNDILNGDIKPEPSKENTVNWLRQFREHAENLHLLETGGLDTHSENPFLKK